ncbi:MAG: hypothetical protein ABSF83_13835, partial [Nitrososphaerales archaeon]
MDNKGIHETLFCVKVALLVLALGILVSNLSDLFNASASSNLGTIGYGNTITIEGVNFIAFLQESIIASIITVAALLVDVLE